MAKQDIKVTYRDIAKMLCRALPLEGKEWGVAVNSHLETIKALPPESKTALKSAYIFSRKVPRQDREDVYQELFLAVFEAKTKDEPLAYAIARCDWKDWWQARKVRQHYFGGSLDKAVIDGDGNETTVSELLVGEVEFERKICSDMDAQSMFNRLPEWLKPLIEKRLRALGIMAFVLLTVLPRSTG